MPCGLRSPSWLAPLLARGLGRVDRVAEQYAEGALVFLVLGHLGHGRAHRLRALLDPLAEFAVGQDVQLIAQDALQYPLPDRFLGAEQVKEAAELLAALVRLG